MSRPTSQFLSLVLLVSLVAVPGITAGTAPTATQAETVDRTFTASLTPGEPGEIRIELQYDVPDSVTTLTTTLPADASVQSTNGFQQRSGNTYDWSRTTNTPTITYDLPVNQTVTRSGGEGTETTGFLYVDTGDWAITRAPRAGVTYSGTGPQPELTTDYAFSGSGATSGDILYLGPFEEHARSAAGQQFRLVVPRAADMRSSPDAVLDSVGSAAESLAIGPRDAEVVAIAAPTTVEWGSTGLQRGASDFWVRDRQGVNSPNNVWIHEYVHTRQVYRTTNETRWTFEGMADYYAALLTYQQDRIGYDRYRRHLEAGEDHQGAVLADPETWRGTLADYEKGALVFAALDRQLRLETDGTLQDVIEPINNGTAEQREFLDAVESVGGSDPRSFAERYTETDDVPETWSLEEQREAFGGPQASVGYSFVTPYDRTGPYRTDTVEERPAVVVGESLALRVAVENTGSASGTYRAELRQDGVRIATRRGALDPGERTVVTFDREFTDPGEHRLTVGGTTEFVTVRDPASPRVNRLDAPQRAAPGDSVTVEATVGNPATRPANGTVTLAVDGEPLTTKRVTLAVGETATLTATTTLQAGDHTVTAGGRKRTISVTTATATTPTASRTATATVAGTDTSGQAAGTGTAGDSGATAQGGAGTPTSGDGPGVGAVGALVALVLLGRLFVAR